MARVGQTDQTARIRLAAGTIRPERRDQLAARQLVVVLHDVAPPFEPILRQQISRLRALGIDRFVFKVVPNWHGAYPLPEAPTLVGLLASEMASGSEIVLHGLEHCRRGSLTGLPIDRARARLFAGDASEFLVLREAEARRAVEEGLDLIVRAGLPRPTSFCAPGWLLSGGAERGVRQAGIRWLIGQFSVRDLALARRRLMPCFGYMGASVGHEAIIQFVNSCLVGPILPRAAGAKVFLHPQGGHDTVSYRWSLATIARLVGDLGWKPATYTELCGETRDERGSREPSPNGNHRSRWHE